MPNVLISGASFAGLAAAFWMNDLGYDVTLVEVAKGLRKGGTPVDIRDRTIAIADRMGILAAIKAQSLPPRSTEFRNADDTVAATLPAQSGATDGWEIERDALLDILFSRISGKVEIIFDQNITALADSETGIDVSFAHGPNREFSLVLGCDGNHSAVRKMWFGPEADYSHFMQQYFSISIVRETFIVPNTTQLFSVPGKTVMLNSYDGKTDIVFSFHSAEEIPNDHRNPQEQRQIIRDRFKDAGWRTSDLLRAWDRADNFYFDKLSQIKMPHWTKGRVALVGDAAYCASPAAGMGGSLAIVGATALADALARHPGDFAAAFSDYDKTLRPYIDEVQADAVNFGLKMFFPQTAEDIRKRDEQFAAFAAM